MNGGIIVSAVSIVLAAAAFINAYTFPGGTSDGVPGAGVFPQAICTLIILINVILIIGSLRKRKDSAPISEEHREGRKRLGLFVGLTAVLLLVWGHIHFCILCAVYLTGIGWILKQKMKIFIPGSVVSAVLLYVIFHQLLNVML